MYDRMKRIAPLAALVLMMGMLSAAAYAASADDGDENWWYSSGDEFTVSVGTVNLQVGEERNLRDDMIYQSEDRDISAAGTGVWATDRPEVATVSPEGVVTAIREGSAKISVTYTDNRTNVITRTMRVKVGLAGIGTQSAYTSSEYYFTVNEGKRICLKELLFQDAPAGEIRWSTNRDDLLAVEADGTITAMRYGTGNVTAVHTDSQGNELTKKVTLKIQSMEKEHGFSSVTITLNPGDTVDIMNMFYPGKILPGVYDQLSCTIDSKEVAVVDGYRLTAKSTGSTTLFLELSDTDGGTGAIQRQQIKVQVAAA